MDQQAQALGAAPEDPLLLFSVLYGFWVVNYIAFNGDIVCELADQFMNLAAQEGATVPLMVAHRLMATSLSHTGKLVDGRAHYDQAIALYNPAEHRALAMRFGQDAGVTHLSLRSATLWVLGHPQAALATQICGQAGPSDRSSYNVDVRVVLHFDHTFSIRELRDHSNSAKGAYGFSRGEERDILEGPGTCTARLFSWL